MSKLYAGTSGFAYPSWKPGFYPEKLPAKQFELSLAADASRVVAEALPRRV
jgi:uncharacterized protein YecE (DUF72 family)